METCYKVFRREVLQGIKLKSNRFGFEPEITAKIAKKRDPAWRVYEIPISYSGRTYEEGKKIGFKDALHGVLVHRAVSVFRLRKEEPQGSERSVEIGISHKPDRASEGHCFLRCASGLCGRPEI